MLRNTTDDSDVSDNMSEEVKYCAADFLMHITLDTSRQYVGQEPDSPLLEAARRKEEFETTSSEILHRQATNSTHCNPASTTAHISK